MEEKSRFAQILIFWDAVLLGTLIFISLSVKPGLRCLWLHSAMLAECAIGLLISVQEILLTYLHLVRESQRVLKDHFPKYGK